ncbi:MAG: diadenylate cyclase CdaA [Bryobacteraceae bacterium]
MPQLMLPLLPKLTVLTVLDILAVGILIYQLVLMVRGRHAAHILTGLCTLVVIYLISVWAHLELLRTVLAALAPYSAFALIVMFQSEIRRLLARLGRGRWLTLGRQLENREVAEEIALAIQQMSEAHIGALIVIERDIGLRTFVESGVALDAYVSRDLLRSIFEPRGAMHDGAVIIQGDRIAAGACFLPLSTSPAILRRMGTRHRAAIGVTEETDAVAVAVSEETGQIAIAYRGEMETDVGPRRLREVLTHRSLRPPNPSESHAEPDWKQAGS